MGISACASPPPRAADITKFRFASTSHVSTALIMFDESIALKASLPSLKFGKIDCLLQCGVLGAIDSVMGHSSAKCTCLLGAFFTFRHIILFVDPSWLNPGVAAGMRTVDSIAGGY